MKKNISPRGTVCCFSSYDHNALHNMKSSLMLETEVTDLDFFRQCYLSLKLENITTDDLYLIEKIALKAKSSAENAGIKELLTSSKAIVDTYNDLLSKASLKSCVSTSPMTLSRASTVISEYMESIGLNATAFDEKEAFNVLPDNTAIAILLPLDNIDYDKATEDLFKERNDLKPIRISEYGLLHTLSAISSGIYTDVTVIPSYTKESGADFLINGEIGRYLVAFDKSILGEIRIAADACGLNAIYFAKTTSDGIFRQRQYPDISAVIPVTLIESVVSSVTEASFDLTDENVIEAIYKNAILSSASAVLSMIAKGASRKDMTLYNEYHFPSLRDPRTLGCSLAALLGVYRSVAELCIPEKSKIRYVDCLDTPMLHTDVKIKNCPPKLNAELFIPDKELYLLSFNTDDSGIPDFESLRAMWKYFSSIVDSGDVLAATDITPSTIDILNDKRVILDENTENILHSQRYGIIFATDKTPLHGVRIGQIISDSNRSDLSMLNTPESNII